jgi:aminoglycoside phosphotransferase (APT) family kinase protein
VQALGLDPTRVVNVTPLKQEHGHTLYRLKSRERSFILKCFDDAQAATEVRAYALLARLGVPTLPVYGSTVGALLLEDLAASDAWRLATEADAQRADVGSAVALWYRALHAAGRALLAEPGETPGFLRREEDALSPESVLRTGEQLGLSDHPVWWLAAEHLGTLKGAIRKMPTTLTHNDFHWSNLALSRGRPSEARAVIFDYHLLGLGTRYADFRNVSGALG